MTFTSSDTYQMYTGITGYDAGDVVLTFVYYETLGSTTYWTQAPVIISNSISIIPEFSDETGTLFINTVKANGQSGSPWSSTNTIPFKSVLIKSTGLKKHPNLDLTNYYKVKEAFNL